MEKGKVTFSDGTVYEGDLVNGKPHGKGKKTYKDGKVEEGDWEDGKFLEKEEEREERPKRIIGLTPILVPFIVGVVIYGIASMNLIGFSDDGMSITFSILSLIFMGIPLVLIYFGKFFIFSNIVFFIALLCISASVASDFISDINPWWGALAMFVSYIMTLILHRKRMKNKLTKVQEEAVQELKASYNYAFALKVKETLEQMNKGCDFGEPTIGFNFTHKHQAYVEFFTLINIPSEKNTSGIRIRTTEYEYEHADHTENCVKSSALHNRGCVLDMGGTTVESFDDSQELIDKVFKVLFASTSGCNLYVKGKLIKQSGTLPVYPRQIAVSDD